jgi:hypothetical protein
VNLEFAGPAQLNHCQRQHWTVENRLHWTGDVTFDEDESQIRTGASPRVLAGLRNLAINTFRLAGRVNIAHARRDLHDHDAVSPSSVSRLNDQSGQMITTPGPCSWTNSLTSRPGFALGLSCAGRRRASEGRLGPVDKAFLENLLAFDRRADQDRLFVAMPLFRAAGRRRVTPS